MLKGWVYIRVFATFFLLSTISLVAYNYSLPAGDMVVTKENLSVPPSAIPKDIITWPNVAQASIGTIEDGLLLSKPNQTPKPIASTAKLITALTVLKEKPLTDDKSGPMLSIGPTDVSFYHYHVSIGGSTVAVKAGDELTEYQMLQGLLIRSGNNLADSLAVWAFGSFENYQVAANKLVTELGLKNTTVGSDASGLASDTVSTADDLVLLGIEAMKHDVIREIVSQPSFDAPHEGTRPNTNWLLGEDGVVGIKTGTTPSAGGVFIIAREHTMSDGSTTTLISAVQGDTSTYNAINESKRLVDAMKPHFTDRTIVGAGTVVATATTPWGESADIVSKDDLTITGWAYENIKSVTDIAHSPTLPLAKDSAVGTISAKNQSSSLVIDGALYPPSFWWKLTTIRL